MIDALPQCRWRAAADGGKATCSSPKIRGGQNPFDPHTVCRGCELCDHKPLTEAEVELRTRLTVPLLNGTAAPKSSPAVTLECSHRGEEVDRVACGSCVNSKAIVHACDLHGKSTMHMKAEIDGVKRCRECNDRTSIPPHVRDFEQHALTPISVHRYDESNLLPGTPGQRLNASLIVYQGRPLLAWRLGHKGASILLTEIPSLGGVGRTWRLDLKHRLAQFGREDPRLFVFRDRLHVAFTGVASAIYGVMYAALEEPGGEWRVSKVWAPDYADRELREKNWSFFENAGELYAVYSINPLVVLHVSGSNVHFVVKHEWTSPWQGGVMRGGASPVKVGDEWYLFFHGVDPRDRRYTVGCLVIDNTFKPVRCTRWPIITPSDSDRPVSEGNSAWYVCGAFREGDEWVLSGGVSNSWIEMRRYKAADVEAAMEAVS